MQVQLQITSASVSDRGLSDKRPQNEDSYLELRESGLFAVADGVGGAQAGDVASKMAMEILAEAFLNLQEDADAEQRMQEAIERANSAIFQMSHELAELSSMATTIVALHIKENIATIGHVGDSRLYRLDPYGDLVQETLDHSVVEEEVRAGRMTPEQAAVHPSRNVISRALGAEPLVEIDMKTMIVDPNTMFLACSDGVTRHIEDRELRELLINAPDEMAICQSIKEICYERGAEDNLTAVVVRAESQFPEDFEPFRATDEEEETVATARDTEVNEPLHVIGSRDEEAAASSGSQAEMSGDESEDSEAAPESQDEKLTEEQEAVVVSPAEPNARSDSISMRSSSDQGFLSILSDGTDDSASGGDVVVTAPAENERRSGSFLRSVGRVFMALLLLAIGAAGGVAGYQYWFASAPPKTLPVQQPEPPKIDLSSFQGTKSEVYKNPIKSVATFSANPQNSEDYYFLGLALLLNARYDEANVALTNAYNRLPDYDDANRENLAMEIAMARAVVADPAARQAFTESVKQAESTFSDANSNTGAQ